MYEARKAGDRPSAGQVSKPQPPDVRRKPGKRADPLQQQQKFMQKRCSFTTEDLDLFPKAKRADVAVEDPVDNQRRPSLSRRRSMENMSIPEKPQVPVKPKVSSRSPGSIKSQANKGKTSFLTAVTPNTQSPCDSDAENISHDEKPHNEVRPALGPAVAPKPLSPRPQNKNIQKTGSPVWAKQEAGKERLCSDSSSLTASKVNKVPPPLPTTKPGALRSGSPKLSRVSGSANVKSSTTEAKVTEKAKDPGGGSIQDTSYKTPLSPVIKPKLIKSSVPEAKVTEKAKDPGGGNVQDTSNKTPLSPVIKPKPVKKRDNTPDKEKLNVSGDKGSESSESRISGAKNFWLNKDISGVKSAPPIPKLNPKVTKKPFKPAGTGEGSRGQEAEKTVTKRVKDEQKSTPNLVTKPSKPAQSGEDLKDSSQKVATKPLQEGLKSEEDLPKKVGIAELKKQFQDKFPVQAPLTVTKDLGVHKTSATESAVGDDGQVDEDREDADAGVATEDFYEEVGEAGTAPREETDEELPEIVVISSGEFGSDGDERIEGEPIYEEIGPGSDMRDKKNKAASLPRQKVDKQQTASRNQRPEKSRSGFGIPFLRRGNKAKQRSPSPKESSPPVEEKGRRSKTQFYVNIEDDVLTEWEANGAGSGVSDLLQDVTQTLGGVFGSVTENPQEGELGVKVENLHTQESHTENGLNSQANGVNSLATDLIQARDTNSDLLQDTSNIYENIDTDHRIYDGTTPDSETVSQSQTDSTVTDSGSVADSGVAASKTEDQKTGSESEESSSLSESYEVSQQEDEEEADTPPTSKLHKLANEFLVTERAYVNKLHLVDQVFQFKILIENRTPGNSMFPNDVIPQMFSNTKSIYQFHHDFLLPQLENRIKQWDTDPRLGDIMKKFAPFLKLYTEYVRDFDQAMTTIKFWLDKSPRFANLMNELQKMPECGHLTLQHHMLEPIQRVPRYELLLKEYLKYLPEDSPDREDAEKALELVTKASGHNNEALKKIEQFRVILDLSEQFGGAVDIISPTRELVKQGRITKISARNGEHQERYLFVFNDMLLLCSQLMGYKVKAKMDLDGMNILDTQNLMTPNTFLVKSKQKAIEFHCSTHEEKMDWLQLLWRVVKDYTKKKLSRMETQKIADLFSEEELGCRAPAWVKDQETSMCMNPDCASEFTFMNRRHHCRACGIVVCGSCSSQKAPLAYDNDKLGRVCDNCYTLLMGREVTVKTQQTKKPKVLQVKAGDKSLVSGYLNMSMDKKTWHKRWFAVFEDMVLYSFKAHQDVVAMTSVPLPGYTVQIISESEGVDREHAFHLKHQGTKATNCYLQAENKDTMEKWMKVLEKVVLAELPE